MTFKREFLLLLIGLFSFAVEGQSPGSQWNLVWSDEFNGNSLDTTKWSHEVDCWGGGNGELQCYTARPQNSRVENGNLIITAIPERYTGTQADCTNNNDNTCTATKDFTSARLRTLYDPNGSWLYGRFEVRAQLPKGKQLWPALWMLPKDYAYGTWAASGEIDIMEYRGQVPNKVEGTLHFGGAWPNNRYQGSGPTSFNFDFSQDFHVFALEWERDEVRWYVDGQKYYTMSLDRNFYSGVGPNPYTDIRQPFDKRFHFMINLAIGGGFFPAATYGTLSVDEAKRWESPTMKIDYVRVYQRLPVPKNATASPPPALPPTTTAGDNNSTDTDPEGSSSDVPLGLPVSLNSSYPKVTDTEPPITSTPVANGNGNVQNDAVQPAVSSDTSTMFIYIGVPIGVLFFVILLVSGIATVVVRRKRSTPPSSPVLPREEGKAPQSAGVSSPVCVGVFRVPPLPSRAPPPVPAFSPTIGSRCKAKYSQDNLFYSVTIENIDGPHYLVNYGDKFDNVKEWAILSDLSP